MDENKEKIIKLFNDNVKNKEINLTSYNKKHCGKEGHWLESNMGIKANCKNSPDIYGYEMKKESNKITLGDYCASEYLFSKKKDIIMCKNSWNKSILDYDITRNNFIEWFGKSNEKKNNRYSWSGNCIPKYNEWNNFGQLMSVDNNNNLCIYYNYDKDERKTKTKLPEFLKIPKDLLIVFWSHEKLSHNINNKFNKKGFFIVKKNNNLYDKICFGKPFDYEYFIENIKNKTIFFDSGMYQGNCRNYSHFRSNINNFWNNLIIEEY